MSEWNYIIGAYVLTWVGILGYAIHVAHRLRRAAAALRHEDVSTRSETDR